MATGGSPASLGGRVDARAVLAVANNADLYELLFHAHGIGYRRDEVMFVSDEDPPPYYGNFLALEINAEDAQLGELRRLRRVRPGAIGAKDGFYRLDLGGDGFEILFEASWLWAAPEALDKIDARDWVRVDTPKMLAEWEDAWQAAGSPADRRVFPPSLLSEPACTFLGRRREGAFHAGCIVNGSAECVGLSNIFGPEGDAGFYGEAASASAHVAPSKALVGYDSGDALAALIRCGFVDVGALRVWVAEGELDRRAEEAP